jgi:hypothetical protein
MTSHVNKPGILTANTIRLKYLGELRHRHMLTVAGASHAQTTGIGQPQLPNCQNSSHLSDCNTFTAGVPHPVTMLHIKVTMLHIKVIIHPALIPLARGMLPQP